MTWLTKLVLVLLEIFFISLIVALGRGFDHTAETLIALAGLSVVFWYALNTSERTGSESTLFKEESKKRDDKKLEANVISISIVSLLFVLLYPFFKDTEGSLYWLIMVSVSAVLLVLKK